MFTVVFVAKSQSEDSTEFEESLNEMRDESLVLVGNAKELIEDT